MILNYYGYIKEHKFWGKTIPEFLNWLESKSDKYFILIDTETTGLHSDPYEVQLTQIACIVNEYNPNLNSLKEIDSYNKKLKLTDKSIELMKDPSNKIKKILSFNRYGTGSNKFYNENETLVDFLNFINKYDNPIFVIQNAEFDMKFLNTRGDVKFKNEVIDTKQIAQLFYLPLIQKLSENDSYYRDLVDKIGTSQRDNGLISSSLSKIGPALGINMFGYHDALVDCRLMGEMFTKMIDFLKSNKDLDISKYQNMRIKTL
jgi:DNA polymerase III epsilon subunit-like protein